MSSLEPREAASTPPLLTVEDVARILRVSPKTVYRWARADLIPHVRSGRSVRFPADLVERLTHI